jgi:hypothetical protein
MKFYESHFEDYCSSVEYHNLHEELLGDYKHFPKGLSNFGNIIIYGPSGVGKYSQMLYILKNYSPSLLKYENKLTAIIDKQSYIYKISDIHYEIDMSLLGCNSKLIWHEIFQQIVDIVSVKTDKHGIIVCKNFHSIHNELLDIFYSYMQQYSNNNRSTDFIKIKFILLTEHFSFIPNNIVNNCFVLSVKRPSPSLLANVGGKRSKNYFKEKLSLIKKAKPENIMNLKEIYSLPIITSVDDLPKDNFNVICDNIITGMIHHNRVYNNQNANIHESVDIIQFRDQIYDILIYNLDASECIWYIFTHFIMLGHFIEDKITDLMEKNYKFLKQYGNNYRAIFHIESILFNMISMIKSD